MIVRGLRLGLVLGLVLVVSGLTLMLYFDHYFDTWLAVDTTAPPWVDAPYDPRELALHQSDELVARAEAGAAAGLRLFVPGALLSGASGLGLLLVRTWSARRNGTTG